MFTVGPFERKLFLQRYDNGRQFVTREYKLNAIIIL